VKPEPGPEALEVLAPRPVSNTAASDPVFPEHPCLNRSGGAVVGPGGRRRESGRASPALSWAEVSVCRRRRVLYIEPPEGRTHRRCLSSSSVRDCGSCCRADCVMGTDQVTTQRSSQAADHFLGPP